MKLSLVLSTQPTQFQAATLTGPLESNLAQIAALGYHGVELAIRDPKSVDLDMLVSLTRRHSLEVPAIGTGQAWGEEGLSFTDPNPEIRRAAIERIKSHIPVAERFGALIIIGLIRGVVKPGVAPQKAMDWLVTALRECSRAAALHSVRMALEPINHGETTLINTANQGLELVEQLGESNFGLLLDTYHMSIEETDILASIHRCGDKIIHFHVADSNRWYPGAGSLDFHSILSALVETGYQGYVSGEFLPKPDPLGAARENMATLRPILESLNLHK